MVVDRHPDRLRLAESIGAIAIDDSKVDPVQAVLDETMGLGADNGCECVGYQAHEPDGQEQANLTMNRLVASVRFTGKIGNVGVFVPQDPGASDELAKQGKLAFDYGMFWFKGQHIGSGQAPVKKYNRQLRDLIAARQGRAVVHREPRAAARPGAGGLRALRQPRRRLDQGRPPPGDGRERDMAGDAERTAGRHPGGRRRGAGRAGAAAAGAGRRRRPHRACVSITSGEIQARNHDLEDAGTFAVDQLVGDGVGRRLRRAAPAGRDGEPGQAADGTGRGAVRPGLRRSRASRSPRSATARGPSSRPTSRAAAG